MAYGWNRRSRGFWAPYVPVWKRRQQAEKKARELGRKGRELAPIEIEGRKIANTFWGESWCENLERYSDFENRLPRGRTYVRNGSVIDLQVEAGGVKALVSGSEIYTVSVKFAAFARKRWAAIKGACSGKIDSVVELLQGRLSTSVMEVLTARDTGLFPSPREIEMECSCPDYATMCKHVAAVLYGVGSRLDSKPDLLFILRGIDSSDLASRAIAGAARLGTAAGEAMEAGEMEKVFGIEIDAGAPAPEGAVIIPGPAPGAGSGAAGENGAAPPRRHGRPRKVKEQIAEKVSRAVLDARTPRAGTAGKASGRRGSPWGENGSPAMRIPRLLRHFRKADALTSSDYQRIFTVLPSAASRQLAELTDWGILLRTGRKRGTRYLPGEHLQ